MYKCYLLFKTLAFLFIVNMFHGQEIKILKENIKIETNDFVLQELQICNQNPKIYKIIQENYNLFDGLFFVMPTQRLDAKKKLLLDGIINNNLQESQIGFENYNIFFNKNKILNLSIGLQVYGSPWEDTKFFSFDLQKDSEIGERLFVNRAKLLQVCKEKLKNEGNIDINLKDLSNYKIEFSNGEDIKGISLIFFDINERSVSGYREYSIFFKWKEIEKYIAPRYRSRLKN